MLALMMLAVLQTTMTSAVTTLERSQMSGVSTPRQVVARTADEWTNLWRAHAPDRPAPDVDLSKDMVVAVCLGTRPSGGFAVEIVTGRQDGGALVLRYRETRPRPDAMVAQVLTSPCHIARLPRYAGVVRFEKID